MDSQLKNKVIFITGAAGILGLTSVQLFIDRGAKVIANDIISIDESPILMHLRHKYKEELFQFIQADMTNEQEVKNVYGEIDKRFARLDGLFNNVYRQVQKPVIELSLQEWNHVITGTLTSSFLVCKHAVNSMLASGGGSIVNTSSIISTASFRKKENAAYGAAKAGLNQFTRILAVEYANQGIRANVLLPGAFSTVEKINAMDCEKLQRVHNNIPMGHYGTTEEVSRLAAFLLSDESSYVTSSLYHVDGGYGV